MNKPIRVLQVGMSSFPGGLESYVMNIYRHIDRTKVQFDFFVQENEVVAFQKEIIELGGHIYPFQISLRDSITMHFWRTYRFLINHPEIRIVHLEALTITHATYMVAAKLAGVPIRIMHSHQGGQIGSETSMLRVLKGILKKRLKKFTTDRFACSDLAGKWMYGNDVFTIKHNAIDIKKFLYNDEVRKIIRSKLGIPSDAVVLGTVGRMAIQKNPEYIIDIFIDYHRENHNSYFVYVGKGELESTLQKKVHEIGLEKNILFLGIRDDVNRILQAMDVFLLPSYYEGLPFSLVEAQASGLPCVVSNHVSEEIAITDLVEFIDLDDDISCWSSCIDKIVSKHKRSRYTSREELREELENNGYNIELEAKKMEEFYLTRFNT